MQIDFGQIVNVASAVGTLAAALLIAFQIRSFEDWNRRQISHQILNDFVSGSIEDALETIEQRFGWDILHDGRRYDEIVASFPAATATRDVAELDRLLRRLFRRFEAICISMSHCIVNENTCQAYLFSLLTTVYGSSTAFVDKERQRRKEPRVFEFTERYARKWSA